MFEMFEMIPMFAMLQRNKTVEMNATKQIACFLSTIAVSPCTLSKLSAIISALFPLSLHYLPSSTLLLSC